jgi:hypothetical protein
MLSDHRQKGRRPDRLRSSGSVTRLSLFNSAHHVLVH